MHLLITCPFYSDLSYFSDLKQLRLQEQGNDTYCTLIANSNSHCCTEDTSSSHCLMKVPLNHSSSLQMDQFHLLGPCLFLSHDQDLNIPYQLNWILLINTQSNSYPLNPQMDQFLLLDLFLVVRKSNHS